MGWGVAENVRWKQRLEEGEAVSYVDKEMGRFQTKVAVEEVLRREYTYMLFEE